MSDLYCDLNMGVPRVCGDDPLVHGRTYDQLRVFPAYAGMIPNPKTTDRIARWCSPRMRG